MPNQRPLKSELRFPSCATVQLAAAKAKSQNNGKGQNSGGASGLGEHLTCHVLVSYRYLFTLFFGSRPARIPVDRSGRSICHVTCFHSFHGRMCSLVGRVDTAFRYSGVKSPIPPFGGGINSAFSSRRRKIFHILMLLKLLHGFELNFA